MLATAMKAPEFEIKEDEAKRIVLSLKDVQEAFGVDIDPKTQSVLGLIGVLASCYGPRIIVYNMRKATEKKVKPATKSGQQMDPGSASGAGDVVMQFKPVKRATKKTNDAAANGAGPSIVTGEIAEEYPSSEPAAEKVKRF